MLRDIEELVAMLEACASAPAGACSNFEKLAACESCKEVLVVSACHALRHFVIDEDIRAADQEYDRLQRELLAECAKNLRSAFLKA